MTAIGIGWVLLRCADQPARLVTGLRTPYAWVAEVGPDAAAITLASSLLWLVALWTATALTATALALLPGRFGLLAHTVAGRLTPAVLRRVVVAAAGTSILISPATAFADSAASGAPAPTATANPAPAAAPSLPMDRPGDQAGRGGSSAQPPSLPALEWPTDAADPSDPAAPEPAESRSPMSGDRVRVRAGDSLWSIAAHRLGAAGSAARIQAEWPRWYTANRQLIGADPNLLRPGVSLLAPKPAAPEAGE
ncbi:MAG: LysM domain-containing protein [Jatrophihabitantaceae bacterium]